jgi:hypothetical protein
MTAHDYLVLAIAAFWMVVGGLGLGFTIRRLHHQDGRQRAAVVGHDPLSAVRWQIPNIGGVIFDALAERRIGILGPVTAVVIAALVAYALFLPGRHSAPEVRSPPSAQATAPTAAKGSPYDAVEKVVVPKNPKLVLGLPLYAEENPEKLTDEKKPPVFRYMGRVIQISEAPSRKANSATSEKSLFVTVEDDSGVAQTFEYGLVEWRTASDKDGPELGVILASASPADFLARPRK